MASKRGGSRSHSTDEHLLSLFLKLSPEEREERFLPVADIAVKVGKAPRTVREWFYGGLIHGVYLGKIIRIDLRSMETFLTAEDRRRKGIF